MPICEPQVVKEMLTITCEILHKHFFYEVSDLRLFVKEFTAEFKEEITFFGLYADINTINELNENVLTRSHFTGIFLGERLSEYFVRKMHFTTQEIDAFANILTKYTGAFYDYKPSH